MTRVVLVEPKHPGNVGAVARLLANFAAGPLVLVEGCAIDGEALARPETKTRRVPGEKVMRERMQGASACRSSRSSWSSTPTASWPTRWA